MFNCLFLSLALFCSPQEILGGTQHETRQVFWARRIELKENAPFTELRQQNDEPKSVEEPKPEPVEEPKPTVQTSQTNTDTGEAEQSAYRFLGNFETSHYTATCKGCSGITATGYDVRNTIYSAEGHRIVAVDTSIIPLHSTLRITYKNGTQITAKAIDTGGYIKGQKLDVLVATVGEAYQLGRVMTEVEILVENR